MQTAFHKTGRNASNPSTSLDRFTLFVCCLTCIVCLNACLDLSKARQEDPLIASMCKGDELCGNYLAIWKRQLMLRSQMQEDYFAAHVIPGSVSFSSWGSGKWMSVDYQVTYDWATFQMNNNFIIYIEPQGDAFLTSLGIPEGKYLTEAEIDTLLDVSYYGSITPIVCVEHLAYESQDDALLNLQEKTEGIPFNFQRLSYYDGYPGLHAFGVKNMATNECVYGKVNLASGYIELLPTVCFISEE